MKRNILLLLSIISSVSVILYMFFINNLDLISSIFVPLLAFGIFFFVTILAILTLVENWQAVVIQMFTILLLFLVPFNQIILDINFKWNKTEREQVAKLVKSGELKPNVSYDSLLIHLPKKYTHLSIDGDIVVEKTDKGNNILFFAHKEIFGSDDNFSGFVYMANNQKPFNKAFGESLKTINKLDKNWYFVATYR